MKRILIISAVVVLGLGGIIAGYSNCGDPAANTTFQGSDLPTNMLVWRPNRVAFFSCSLDPAFQGGSFTDKYHYPTFVAWYTPTGEHSDDSYPAGLSLSQEGRGYVSKNHLNTATTLKYLPNQQIKFAPLESINAPWGFPLLDPTAMIGIDYGTQTNTTTIAGGGVSSFGFLRSTVNVLPQNPGYIFFGLLFQNPSDPSRVNYIMDANNVPEGEAVRFYINHRGISAYGNLWGSSITNKGAMDVLQDSPNTGYKHEWDCSNGHYFITTTATANCGANGVDPYGQESDSPIVQYIGGTFGMTYPGTGSKCFHPTGSIECYANGFDPLVAHDQATDWWKAAGNGWESSNSTTAHWVTICKRKVL